MSRCVPYSGCVGRSRDLSFRSFKGCWKGGFFFVYGGRCVWVEKKKKREIKREKMEGRSLLQFGGDRGKMTTHRVAFSLVESVCWTSLRPPWPPWPSTEFAAVRSDILEFGTASGSCCQREGCCSYAGNGFGDSLGYRCSKLIKKDSWYPICVYL